MWQVPIDALGGWTVFGGNGLVAPTSAVVVCPGCLNETGFPLSWNMSTLRAAPTCIVTCNHCRSYNVTFLVLEPNKGRGADWGGQIWMHPDPPTREELQLEGLVDERLIHRYREANRLFNLGIWAPSAQSSRVVLEGIVKNLLEAPPDDRRFLGELLRDLPAKVDLVEPLRDVASTLQAGGNMASHFGEADIDQETARGILEILDAFIEYLILVPAQTRRLREMLGKT